MPKAKTVAAPEAVEQRLASLSLPLEGVGPRALLQHGKGMPRGFWAREGRWFAHFGRVATLGASSAVPDQDRFSQVWRQARDLLSCSWRDPDSEIHPPTPRLFGGFSFLDDHDAGGPWDAFPLAQFVLPEVELVGGEGGGVLTFRRLLTPGQNPKECREGLRRELEDLRDSLLAGEVVGEKGMPWIPATRFETDQEAWESAVQRVLEAVQAGEVSKVVLSRVQSVDVEEGLDPVDVAMNLWAENPGSHVFFFEPDPGHAILGAAPETVATVSGGHFRATAVAGSISRGTTERERKTLAASLLRSRKDRHEHQMCVEDMVERLTPLSEEVTAQDEPHVLTLSSIQHLETVIEAQLHPGESALSVLGALHPTPAVCGFPRDRALELLRREEPFQRGWYSGPVGWFDGDGNGVFVPALRFAVGQGREWRLFAGAGIVAGSKPSEEWDETGIKFQPVLKALSGAGAPRKGPDDDA